MEHQENTDSEHNSELIREVLALRLRDPTQPWKIGEAYLLAYHIPFLTRHNPPIDLDLNPPAQSGKDSVACIQMHQDLADSFDMALPEHRIGLFVAIIISYIIPHIKLIWVNRPARTEENTAREISRRVKSDAVKFETPDNTKGLKNRKVWIGVFVLGWMYYLRLRDNTLENPEREVETSFRNKLSTR